MLALRSTINLAPTPARQADETRHRACPLHRRYHGVSSAQRDQSYPETLECKFAVWSTVTLHKNPGKDTVLREESDIITTAASG
jgi:hypothetical protein